MGIYEVVKNLCDKNGIPVTVLESKLGFGRGSIGKMRSSQPSIERIQKIADFFGVSVEYLMGEKEKEGYYLNPETARVAQEIFENDELRALFDVQKDLDPDDLRALHSMALALKRKERYQ